jgi:hypothetical protein
MSYDEFLDIPVSVLKDLETILLLKSKCRKLFLGSCRKDKK